MKKHIKIPRKKLKISDPKLKEECGVFGISNAEEASALTALGRAEHLEFLTEQALTADEGM